VRTVSTSPDGCTRDLDVHDHQHYRPLSKPGKNWCMECEMTFSDALTLQVHNALRHGGRMPRFEEQRT
jgi:hypothetical protein